MESKEERLLRAIFGNEPQAKAIKFSMNLDDLTVNESQTCDCSKGCKWGGKNYVK